MARAIILALVACCLAAGSLASDEPIQKLTVTKELVYTAPPGVEVTGNRFASAGLRWACIGRQAGKEFVILDGVGQRAYGKIIHHVFSPDGRRFAYVGLTGEGTRGRDYQVSAGVAYVPAAEDGGKGGRGKLCVILDGQLQGAYDVIDFDGFGFSPDGTHFAYAAGVDREGFVVLDGIRQPAYDRVSDCTFSGDGKRFAYLAKKGDEWFAVVDGVPQRSYHFVFLPWFSPRGEHFGYIASDEKHHFYVIDGGEEPPYGEAGALTFSPDGKRFAYRAFAGETDRVVADGVEQKAYRLVDSITFSPDSRSLAYVAHRSDGKDLIVLDGAEQRVYDQVWAPTFSADGTRFAYQARMGGLWFVVVDGQRSKEGFTEVTGLTFSPDGTRFAYQGAKGLCNDRKCCIVVDGVKGNVYEWTSDPVFGRDGKRVAYWASKGDEGYALVLAGAERGSADEPCGDQPERLGSEGFVAYGLTGSGRYEEKTETRWFGPGSKLYRFVGQ